MTTTACNERVKSSDTSTSIATTGVGLRIDPPPAEWFLAKVTAVTTSGGFNVYSLAEVEPVATTYGYQTKSGGFTTSYAAELNNATVAVNTIVYARFRCYHSTTGETYEFRSTPEETTHHTYFTGGVDSVIQQAPPGELWAPLPPPSVLGSVTIPTGKIVRGTLTAMISFGSFEQYYGNPALISAWAKLWVTGTGMTANPDGTNAVGYNSNEIYGSSFNYSPFFDPYTYGGLLMGVNMPLTASFNYANTSGSNKVLGIRVEGVGTTGWFFGASGYFNAGIDSVHFYYSLKNYP